MSDEPTQEVTVIVHQAGSWTEFLVLRSLLASEGIESLAPNAADPFPMRQPPKGLQSLAILVLESQAEAARRVIAEHLASPPLEEGDEPALE